MYTKQYGEEAIAGIHQTTAIQCNAKTKHITRREMLCGLRNYPMQHSTYEDTIRWQLDPFHWCDMRL